MARPLEAVLRFKVVTNTAMRGFSTMRRGMSGLFEFTRRFRGGLLNMNSLLMSHGATMVAAGMAARSTVRNYRRYSDSQRNLRAILASTNQSMNNQRYLTQSADRAARQYGLDMADTAGSMGRFLETGISVHEATRYFGTAAQFARASNISMDVATRALVDSMRQFNMNTEEGARLLAGSFTVGGRMSATTIQELQQAFRYASVELSGMGYRSEEVIAALGGLSAMGLRSTTAGTRLRRMLVQLINPTRTTVQRFEELGIAQERLDDVMWTGEGTRRDFVDSTMRLSSIFADLATDEDKLRAAVQLFGLRGLAPGVMFARLHARGEDWLRTIRALQDPQQVQNNLTRAAAQSMSGFGAQMDIAKTALQELGIAFMEVNFNTDNAREGFGTWLRELAFATRYVGTESPTAMMTRDFKALSPEMQARGREVNETFKGIWVLLKVIGKVGLWFGGLAGRVGVQWSSAIVVVGAVLRPVIGAFARLAGGALFRLIGRGISGLGRSVWRWASAIASARGGLLGVANIFARVSLWVAAFDAVVKVSLQLSRLLSRITGYGREFDQSLGFIRQKTDQLGLGWIRYIPIFGAVVELVSLVVAKLTEAVLLMTGITSFRLRGNENQTDAAIIDERIRARMRSGYTDEDKSDLRRREVARLRSERMMELAAGSAGRRGGWLGNVLGTGRAESAVALENAGYTEEQARAMRAELSHLTRTLGTADQGYIRLRRSSTQLAESLSYLDAEARRLGGGEATPAQDVSVSRGGYLPFPVSVGDVLVNRNALATAVTGGAGTMVSGGTPTQVSGTPQGQHVSSRPLQLQLDIPVMVDGREIARAAGRYELQVDQRRGARIAPGSRRRVTEQGVR